MRSGMLGHMANLPTNGVNGHLPGDALAAGRLPGESICKSCTFCFRVINTNMFMISWFTSKTMSWGPYRDQGPASPFYHILKIQKLAKDPSLTRHLFVSQYKDDCCAVHRITSTSALSPQMSWRLTIPGSPRTSLWACCLLTTAMTSAWSLQVTTRRTKMTWRPCRQIPPAAAATLTKRLSVCVHHGATHTRWCTENDMVSATGFKEAVLHFGN